MTETAKQKKKKAARKPRPRPARMTKVEKIQKKCGPTELALLVELFETSSKLEGLEAETERKKAAALAPVIEEYGFRRAGLVAESERIRKELGVPDGVDFNYNKDTRTMTWLAPPSEKGT